MHIRSLIFRAALCSFVAAFTATRADAAGTKPLYVCSLYRTPVYLALAEHVNFGQWNVSGWWTIEPQGCRMIMVDSFRLRWTIRSAFKPDAAGPSGFDSFGVKNPIWFRVERGHFRKTELPGVPGKTSMMMAPFMPTTVEDGTVGTPVPKPYQLAILPSGGIVNSSPHVVLHLAPGS